MNANVLVLEDDVLLGETLQDFLECYGYQAHVFHTGAKAIEASYRTRFDVYLMDINLPDMSGLECLRLLREGGDTTPAMVITSAKDTPTLLKGYAVGADDYVKKPFDLEELKCRIGALLMRSGFAHAPLVINETFCLDTRHKRVLKNGDELNVNPKDIELLTLLLEYRGKVVTKEMIIERLWSASKEPSEGALRVYVNNLKKIFGKEAITNVRGLGYRFEA
ncbi:MAG: response regulator transcription factor [Campylobacterales bacterium]|nr:response regulator transcription factor [Campylobacterales bacterium]